jgi:oligopeptide transport system ATP-binding protein
MPRLDEHRANRLQTIGGQPPNLQHLPDGCRFRDRCSYAFDRCAVEKPVLRNIAEGRAKTCHLESL